MKKRIITISQAVGSGGRTIGKEVAKCLKIPYYDKELMDKIFESSSSYADFIEEIGEYAPEASNLLFNIAMFPNSISTMGIEPMADQQFVYQTNVIRRLAEEGPCVIIGCCADYALRDREDCIHVFIHADMKYRTERIVRLCGYAKQMLHKRWARKSPPRCQGDARPHVGKPTGQARPCPCQLLQLLYREPLGRSQKLSLVSGFQQGGCGQMHRHYNRYHKFFIEDQRIT